MKKIILYTLLLIAFTGCSTHNAHYTKAKETYLAGKAVADVIPKDAETENTLDILDWFVVEYATIRSIVVSDDANLTE